jgi:phosphate:Na+ symporter
MLLALHILLDTLAPAENTPSVCIFLQATTGDPPLCLLVAAILTWAAHSSAAVVLFVMSLGHAQFIIPIAALEHFLGRSRGGAADTSLTVVWLVSMPSVSNLPWM